MNSNPSSSWSPHQENRHTSPSAGHASYSVPPAAHPSRWPPMSRMQLFSAKADLELQRLQGANIFDNSLLGEVVRAHQLPRTEEPELQEALYRLLRAEMACDFAGAVRDAEDAALSARPEDVERVAAQAAAASARRRASERAAAHQAHVVDVIREDVPVAGAATATGVAETAMEIIGYVGATGNEYAAPC